MVLKNVSKEMQIHNLPHDIVCGDTDSDCGCSVVEHRALHLNPETGDKGYRVFDKKLCASLHIAVGESSEDLPDSVLTVDTIKQACRSGLLIASK